MIRPHIGLGLLVLASACGGKTTTQPPVQTSCDNPAVVTLSPGQHAVLDPASSGGCFQFPSPLANAEYLVGVVSGSGEVTTNGVYGPSYLKAYRPAASASPAVRPSVGPEVVQQERPLPVALQFDMTLRRREAELAQDPAIRPTPAMLAPVVSPTPPVVGSEREFSVCHTLQCLSFDTVAAVAKYVGTKTAVYLDKSVPTSDPFTQDDLDNLGGTFDNYIHAIDVNAFGNESDLDGNGVVIILLTDAVNALTPDCSNGRILGFFYGGDLTTRAGSNRSEIFYGMVPAPATQTCTAAGRQSTVNRLKPTMIHEFQHMISYNQHVLIRSGPAEDTWLNEAMSHFAEELGGRLIPDSECPDYPTPGEFSCRSQYISPDLEDAYDYLADTQGTFMVFPSSSNGTLKERGAIWIFLRWLADQFGTDSVGTNVTRALEQTTQIGAANVTAVTGQPFATLVSEWFLANYADDLPGFTPLSPRMAYTSWGFRAVFQANCCTPNAPFPKAFPTDAPLITGAYTWSGTLRSGSGKLFRVQLDASVPPLLVQISRNSSGQALDAALVPRVGILRIQ